MCDVLIAAMMGIMGGMSYVGYEEGVYEGGMQPYYGPHGGHAAHAGHPGHAGHAAHAPHYPPPHPHHAHHVEHK